jgi:hypothetical protein
LALLPPPPPFPVFFFFFWFLHPSAAGPPTTAASRLALPQPRRASPRLPLAFSGASPLRLALQRVLRRVADLPLALQSCPFANLPLRHTLPPAPPASSLHAASSSTSGCSTRRCVMSRSGFSKPDLASSAAFPHRRASPAASPSSLRHTAAFCAHGMSLRRRVVSTRRREQTASGLLSPARGLHAPLRRRFPPPQLLMGLGLRVFFVIFGLFLYFLGFWASSWVWASGFGLEGFQHVGLGLGFWARGVLACWFGLRV